MLGDWPRTLRALPLAALLVAGAVLTAVGVQPALSVAAVYLVHYSSLKRQLVRTQAQT